MAMFLIFLVLLVVLAFAATRWGFDSRDKLDSPEWQRRADRIGSSIL
jgi:sensor domain CHASE-containing protein